MSVAREPSASRGEITLQPSYFTSSLYVQPLREDISTLITLFSDQFDHNVQPFDLFKKLWTEQGWCWLHMRVYDGRARQSFIRTTERLFAGGSHTSWLFSTMVDVHYIRAHCGYGKPLDPSHWSILAVHVPHHPTKYICTSVLFHDKHCHPDR